MAAATLFSYIAEILSQLSIIFRIQSILGRKQGLGVSMCLIRSCIFCDQWFGLYLMLALTMLSLPSSWKGWQWQLSTKSTHPSIQTSTLSSMGYLRYRSIISGGRYIRVVFFQKRSSQWYILDFDTCSRLILSLLQLPKSHNLKSPSLPKRMFSTLTSWWKTSSRCIDYSPAAVSFIIFRIYFQGSTAPFLSRSERMSKTVFQANYIRIKAYRKPSFQTEYEPWQLTTCRHPDNFFITSTSFLKFCFCSSVWQISFLRAQCFFESVS